MKNLLHKKIYLNIPEVTHNKTKNLELLWKTIASSLWAENTASANIRGIEISETCSISS